MRPNRELYSRGCVLRRQRISPDPYGNRATPVDLSVAEMLVVHSATGVIAADVALVQAYLTRKYAL